MKRWTLLILALSLMFMPIAAAVDFIPQGNISLQNVYWIKNNPAGSCSAGKVVSGILANGSWNCTSASSGTGDITDVNAGTGITVTNPTGPAPTVALNITYTASLYVNRSDWTSLDNYPANCIANYFVQGLNDTLNCSRPVPESDSNWALHNAYPSACGTGYVVQGLGDSLTCVLVDPEIAYLTANKMCVANGTGEAINCTAAIPVDTDTWATNYTFYYTITQGNATYVKNSSWLNCAGTNNFTSSMGVCSAVSFTGYYTSSQTDTAISNANTSMKNYVDARDTATNTSATTYSDARLSSAISTENTTMKAYVDSRDTATNTSATTYSDARLSGENSSMKAYVDARDTATNTSATTYSDAKDTATNTSMKNYVDARDTVINTSATTYSDARLTSVDTATNTTVVNWANGIFDKKTDSLNCGRMTGNTSDLCTITPGGTDTFAQNISAVGACDSTNKLYILSGSLACDNDLVGEGGAGENYWVDGGAYLYPNSTYAVNLAVFGYINSTDWGNVSITNWANQMNSYPAACGSNTVATTIGDTLTCVGIGNTYILANAINTSQIVDGTILSGDIAGGAITNSLIAANAVNSSQIVDGTILSGDIAGGAITNTLIAANTVNASQITGFLTCTGTNNFTTGFGTCGVVSFTGYYTSAQTDTAIGNANTSMKGYVDGRDTATNTSATTYSDARLSSAISTENTTMKAYVDARDTSIISTENTTMKAYVDARDTSIISTENTTMKAYVDARDTAINTSATTYSDARLSAENSSMKSYVDARDTAINTSATTYSDARLSAVDTATNTTMKNYVDARDTATNTSATTYSDARLSAVDTATNTTMKNYVDARDTATNTSATTYSDARLTSVDTATNTTVVNWATGKFVELAGDTMSGNLAMGNTNVTAVQCIIFQSGGKICSG